VEPSLLSLLPPLVTIVCAIATRRILISLALGIVLGALLYAQGDVLAAGAFVLEVAAGLVVDDGEVAEEVYILAVVLLLGVLTSLIYVSGGLVAFAAWATALVRTRVQAQLVPVVLGIVIFFDDAFSSLVGGNISRSITDQHRISRAKLSYLVDSTAAPVIILVPISGWAAFIAATMTGILDANGITGITGYEAFLQSVPMNLYAITALLLAIATAVLSLAFGSMRRHELAAVEDGLLVDHSRGPVPGETDRTLEARGDGRVGDLLWPVLVLTGVTVICAVWFGIANTEGPLTPMEILANTDVIISLLIGVVAACLLSTARLLARGTPAELVGRATVAGLKSMLVATVVLFLAWVTAGVISELGIGEYLAGIVDTALPLSLLPVLLFVLASFISFSIGSTFGTFGLLLPIAGEIAVALDPALLVPMFGAVLAGAIFGDHTSPLSDTTILSSIGSGIQLIEHVTTQLPFALVAAGASAVGYVLLGVTGSGAVGLLAALATLAVAIAVLWARSRRVGVVSEPRPGA
jgi:tetracycline resistance efflux pump